MNPFARHIICSAVFGAVATAAFASATSVAEAYTNRIPASACMSRQMIYPSSAGYDPVEEYQTANGMVMSTYYSLGDGPELYCPVTHDSTAPLTSYTTSDVYVFDGSAVDALYVQLCANNPSGTTASCGTQDFSVDGNDILHPGFTAWASTSYFAFVFVKLPAATNTDNTGWSTIKGIKLSY